MWEWYLFLPTLGQNCISPNHSFNSSACDWTQGISCQSPSARHCRTPSLSTPQEVRGHGHEEWAFVCDLWVVLLPLMRHWSTHRTKTSVILVYVLGVMNEKTKIWGSSTSAHNFLAGRLPLSGWVSDMSISLSIDLNNDYFSQQPLIKHQPLHLSVNMVRLEYCIVLYDAHIMLGIMRAYSTVHSHIVITLLLQLYTKEHSLKWKLHHTGMRCSTIDTSIELINC